MWDAVGEEGVGMTELWMWGQPGRWPLALGFLGLGLVLVIRAYGWRPRGRLLAAAVCKLLLWGLLAAMLCDPLRVRQTARQDANEVVVAVDASMRLEIPSERKGPKRSEQVRAALQTGQPWMEEIEKTFRLRLVEAGDRLRAVREASELRFESTQAEPLRALKSLRGAGTSRPVAAVVLITDGHAADAALADELSAQPGAAVFPVLTRAEQAPVDLAITEVRVAQTPFEDTPVTLSVTVKALGWKGRSWQLLVLDEAGQTKATTNQPVSREEDTATVRLRLSGVKPGVSFFQVRLADARLSKEELTGDGWGERSEELTLLNNERLVAVDRGAGPFRVLYVAGRPNWEHKFLRRALAADPEIQLPALLRIAKREPKFEWRGRTGESSNPLFRGFGDQAEVQRYDQPVLIRLDTVSAEELRDGFPKAAEVFFATYRALVLDDVEAAFFSVEQQRLIEQFVSDRGGSLLMLGGQESYREGGYEHTVIGRMLPVYLDRPGVETAVADGRWNLTREGWLEPWLRLRAGHEEEEARLARMPGFFAMNRVPSIKPGAALLATVAEAEGSLPALVTQRFGQGRVTALLVADAWRWGMRDDESRVDMEKFWRQLFRWSVVDVPDRVDLQISEAEAGGARVKKLAVRARDEAFRPLDDALVRLEVRQGAAEPVVLHAEPSLQEAGLFEAEWAMPSAGAFRVETQVELPAESGPSEKLAVKAGGWAFDPVAEVTADLLPPIDWMTKIAEKTGGQVLRLEDLNELPERLRGLDVPVMDRRIEPLWHWGGGFALLLGLLVAEWILRRRSGWT